MATAYAPELLARALPLMVRPNPALLASGTYHVAETDGGAVVGCGGWTRERPGTREVQPGLAHIRHFATRAESAGRGVGRAVYRRREAQAVAAGGPPPRGTPPPKPRGAPPPPPPPPGGG